MINSILIYNSGGGIGDALQILPLINTLKSELKNAKFYYLSAHENYFNTILKDFNTRIDSLNLDIKYFGFRWWHSLIINKKIKNNKIEKFDLIIDLQSKIRNSLILKMIPHKFFISPCINFKLSNPRLVIKKEKKIYNTILNAMNLSFEKNYKIKEFNIDKIDEKFFIEAKRLLPNKNYIGFSITQGNIYRKKEWPLDKVISVANKFVKSKKIPVFLVEKKNIELKQKILRLLPMALFPEHETNISSPALVTCLGRRLDLVITIDNGIMHMLSLGKVPMIALFGPTDSEKFAPDYEKLTILDSKKLYRTKNVSSISVEDILESAKQHLNF